jgi:hypothetical protein
MAMTPLPGRAVGQLYAAQREGTVQGAGGAAKSPETVLLGWKRGVLERSLK